MFHVKQSEMNGEIMDVKIKKRTFLLLCVLLLSVVLASCENVVAVNSTETSEKNVEQEHVETLPEMLQYAGNTFVLAAPDEKRNCFSTEEESESIVKAAAEKRNNLINEKYGIKIEYKSVSEETALAEMKAAAAAGTQYADLLCFSGETLVTLSDEDQLYNLLSSTSFNISAGYIDTEAAKNITANNCLYMLYSSATQYYDDAWVVFYDKGLISDTGMTDPAILAAKGEWTWDKFLEYSEYIAKNVMSKGSPDVAVDVFGFASPDNKYDLPLAMWESCGTPIFGKTYLQPVSLPEDISGISATVDKLETIYNSKSRFNLSGEAVEEAFAEGRLAFLINKLGYAASLAYNHSSDQQSVGTTENREWGLLPLPKSDKEQKNYVSFVDPEAYAFAIPANITDAQRSIIIMNAYCAASGDSIKEAVYKKYVNLFLENNTSTVLLQTVLDTGYFDTAALYGSRISKVAAVSTEAITLAIAENGPLEKMISTSKAKFDEYSQEKFK